MPAFPVVIRRGKAYTNLDAVKRSKFPGPPPFAQILVRPGQGNTSSQIRGGAYEANRYRLVRRMWRGAILGSRACRPARLLLRGLPRWICLWLWRAHGRGRLPARGQRRRSYPGGNRVLSAIWGRKSHPANQVRGVGLFLGWVYFDESGLTQPLRRSILKMHKQLLCGSRPVKWSPATR